MSAVLNLDEAPNFDAAIEAACKRLFDLPQVAAPVRHIFGPGVYMRELSAKAGTIIIGHKQRTEHKCLFVKGRMLFLNEDGTTTELAAPCEFMAPPGRKVAKVLEDMVFVNVYETDETDVDTLEATYLDKSELPQKLLTYQPDGDYEAMLADIGVSAEKVRAVSENAADQMPFPFGAYKVKVGKSEIEGRGLIATADIESGEIICPARIGHLRTPAGRYTNHAKAPNAAVVEHEGDAYLVALKPIQGCRGGYDGEEITVDYRLTPKHRLELLQ